jgi:membrane fusion protein (multidrug efflux system)
MTTGEAHVEPSGMAPSTARRLGLLFLVAIVLAALLAALMFWRHHHRLVVEGAERQRDVDRGPRVFVERVRVSPAARDLTLPADVRGFFQSTVYAKVAGYVKSMNVDKGDQVRAGQLLGVLNSPEVDQQVAAAEADLVIKKRTAERYALLVKKDFVSKQDYETVLAQYEVARATLAQARSFQSYEVLRAPFAGTITARYVDPGALVPAATGSTQSAAPLVDIADLRRLRVLVFVQQDAAPFVHAGDPAHITFDQRPDLVIDAPVSRCADALDPRTRSMLCEVWLDNTHHLYPGLFVHVTLKLKAPNMPVVESSAILLHADKTAVAVVRDSRVHFVTVRVGLDDGKTVQILDGLRGGEVVALALPAEVAEGTLIQANEKPGN